MVHSRCARILITVTNVGDMNVYRDPARWHQKHAASRRRPAQPAGAAQPRLKLVLWDTLQTSDLETLVLATIRGMSEEEFVFVTTAFRAAYWRLRYERQTNRRRKWYRLARKEKGRLAALGIPQELMRLYGLHLRRPNCQKREQRFLDALEEFQHGPRQLTLF